VDIQENAEPSVQVVDNPFFGNHAPGQVPGFIQSQNANVMLSGGMGQRAVMFFNQMGIQAATGASGTVKDAVYAYLNGDLTGTEPCEESKAHNC
jgi:predicted Fe-Mo cluster-binding NifX family protein